VLRLATAEILVLRGRSGQLGVSGNAVGTRPRSVFARLGGRSRAQLANLQRDRDAGGNHPEA
jgi:DNA-binding CsgD family transcriptional regulator